MCVKGELDIECRRRGSLKFYAETDMNHDAGRVVK
jgi:hypothetical protein